ncbi:MAG TPA: helix-turn-helix domain-containing protein [Baekduia sp.]
MSEAAASPRRRDAAATRTALLVAARELFDAHGFRGTTVRMIGERAGVDQALIARYFGGKSELYQAVLADAAAQPDVAPDDAPAPRRRTTREVVDLLLERVDEHGVGPVLRAMTAPPDVEDEASREQLTARVRERVIVPLARSLKEAGASEPKLRAELVVAMLIGVMTTRANGSLPRVAGVERGELAELLEGMLGS